jgi:hypothetical protein
MQAQSGGILTCRCSCCRQRRGVRSRGCLESCSRCKYEPASLKYFCAVALQLKLVPQLHTQDAGAKGKQVKEMSRRAIEKLDAALRDEKSVARTLKSRVAEAEERERRMSETHAAELGILQKRLRSAELRSKELQACGGPKSPFVTAYQFSFSVSPPLPPLFISVPA